MIYRQVYYVGLYIIKLDVERLGAIGTYLYIKFVIK